MYRSGIMTKFLGVEGNFWVGDGLGGLVPFDFVMIPRRTALSPSTALLWSVLVKKLTMVWLVSWEGLSIVSCIGHMTTFSLLKTEVGTEGRYGITMTWVSLSVLAMKPCIGRI